MGMSTYKGYFEAWELEGGKSVESGLKKEARVCKQATSSRAGDLSKLPLRGCEPLLIRRMINL